MADAVWAITELQRTGAGTLQERSDGERFRWNGPQHTLPKTGVEIETQVNTVRTTYSGTEGPVEQVLSIETRPFTIDGEWNDKFVGPGFAASEEERMEAMVGRGALVRMDFQQFSYTGIITNYARRLFHATHIEWTLTFSPHFRDSQESTARAGRVVPVTAKPLREQATETGDTTLALESILEDSDGLILGTDDIAQTTTVVESTRAIQNGVDERAAEGLTDDSQEELRTQQERYQALQQAGWTSADRMSDTRTDEVTGFDSVEQRLGIEQFARGIRAAGRVLVDQSYHAQRDLDLVLVAQPQALIRPPTGMSVYHAAAQYKDDVEGWRSIAIAAGLSELIFDGVTDFEVPVDRSA